MSTLQIGLAVAGGLVLAAVVAHGAWTSRKMAPRQATPAEPDGTAPGLIEPRLEADAFSPDAFALPVSEKKASLDSLIDVITPIGLESEVSGEAALAALPATRRVGSKPFAVEGLNSATRVWEPPAAGNRYDAFRQACNWRTGWARSTTSSFPSSS